MIDELKPYPTYHDSCVPWLGDIPAHWETERAKWLFQRMKRPVRPDDDIVTCFRDGTVTLRKNRRVLGFTNALKEIGYQGVRKGDLVIHAMDAFAGAVGVSDSDGKCTPVYAVCQPQSDSSAHYYAGVVREMARSHWIAALAKGVRERSTDFRFEGFAAQVVPVPPPEEQAAIARFLDHIDRRTQRHIRAQRKLIALLEEQIAARVAEAMRHPAHRSERLGTIAVQRLLPVTRDSASHYTALGLFNRGRGLFHKAPRLGSDLGDSMFFWVEPGDLVISGQFAWEGAVALASSSEKNTVVSHRYYLLQGIDGRSTTPYLWALLRSGFGGMLLDQHSRGGAGRNRPLNLSRLLKEKVPVPPLEEQLAIDELVRSMAPIRIDIKSKISLLEEYRTRLIADVVTGKLDVRQAAANLPEEAEDAEDWDADAAEEESDEDSDEVEVEVDE